MSLRRTLAIRKARRLPWSVWRRVREAPSGIPLPGRPGETKTALSRAAAAIARDSRKGELDAEAVARLYRRLQDTLELALLRDKSLQPPVEARKGAQSKHFMSQLVPYVHRHMSESPRGTHFSILDVGPGTGHGSNLLGSLYATQELGYTATVSTLDTNRVYEPYLRVFCRYITPKFGNIFAHTDRYDIVIASHVVEHVKETPVDFCRRLRELSRGIVIVCAPYREPPEKLTEGHRHSLDDDFLAAIEPTTLDLFESPAWGWFEEPRYRMFVAVLAGAAPR